MAQGKASPNDARQRRRDPVDDDAPAPRARSQRPAPPPEPDISGGGLFVDSAPHLPSPEAEPKKPARAAERRRERGDAPEPAGPKDTRTALRRDAARDGGRDGGRDGARNGIPRLDTGASDLNPAGYTRGSLTCVRGTEEGLALQLLDGSYTIGRARDNNFVLKDIASSRQHLRLDVTSQGVRAVDLGSGNGTRINGKRAQEALLRHGDKVEIGSTLFVFADPGRDVPADQDLRAEQQRVVDTADQLAAELSAKLRFGDESKSPGFEDGHAARTRALRTADARAAAEAIAREDAARAEKERGNDKRKGNDRLWNETFTNMPLSAVVPGDDRPRAARPDPSPFEPRPSKLHGAPPPGAFEAPSPPPDVQRPRARARGVVQEFSESIARGTSSVRVAIVLLVVVIVAGLGVGGWALHARSTSPRATDAVVDERAAALAQALANAEAADKASDWPRMKAAAELALQMKPDEKIAQLYLDKATAQLAAVPVAPSPPAAVPAVPAPANPASTTSATVDAAAPAGAAPVNAVPSNAAPVVAASSAVEPVAVVEAAPTAPAASAPRPVAKPAPRPAAKPKPPKKAGMSDDDANALFADAIAGLRAGDKDEACAKLEKVAKRAPSTSVWKSKAEARYSKSCE